MTFETSDEYFNHKAKVYRFHLQIIYMFFLKFCEENKKTYSQSTPYI